MKLAFTSSRNRLAWGSASIVALVASLLAVVAPASAARARSPRVQDVRIVSGGGRKLGNCQLLDWKIEVSLAVSPADPRRMTASWIQGVRSADPVEALGTSTNMWATSTDGGKSWTTPQPVAGLTTCTGAKPPETPVLPGLPDWGADPSVSFGRDGTAYLASVRVHSTVPQVCCGDVYAKRSRDGGLHWDAPLVVDEPLNGIGRNDPAFVTADPKKPGRAYLAWNHGWPLELKFASTNNGGATWSPGTIVALDTPGHVFDLAPVQVLPDSSLLLFYVDYLLTEAVPDVTETAMGTQTTKSVHVLRSTNGGRSWSAPIDVAAIANAAERPGVATARDGSVYFAWTDPTAAKVMIVRSTDGGRRWSRPRTVATRSGAQLATIAVKRDGTLGITWYDSRRASNKADVWFASSRNHGVTWRETHVGGPFDLDVPGGTGPAGDDWPMGGYEGLVATRDGFAAAFVMATPQAKTGPTDVFFARIRV